MPDSKNDSYENPDVMEIPIEDHIDLHTFSPKEAPELLDAYFEACREHGITEVRIIHGKGTGQLRAKVESILKKNKQVASFHPAPPEHGGWGATMAKLIP